jgi:hypothetical protein
LNRAFNVPTDGNQNWGWRHVATAFRSSSAVEIWSGSRCREPANTRTMVPETVLRPRIHSWNVAVERQLPYSLSVDVAYVGNRSDGQWADINQNASTVLGPECAVYPLDPSDITCPSQTINGVAGLNNLRPYVSRLDANGNRVPTINPKTGQRFPAR